MRLTADGTTPNSRLVLVDVLETADGYAFEPARPFFLAVGDRIAFENDRLVVVRTSGERLSPAGNRSTRCKPGALRDHGGLRATAPKG
ncbi:hypothetical protein [Streptomyces sp. NPDC098101]|uniref:hypothetical protein n=1 Tax=Streptomyces sp. NPDC098101 TaxID=3366096 RepID=UPI00382C7599